MAKQIVVLETNPDAGGFSSVRYLLWLPVIPGREVPKPELTASTWRGAAQDEIQALRLGQVIEEVYTLRVAASTAANTIKAALVAIYTDRAAAVAALPNSGQYYGISYDPGAGGWSA